MTEYIERQKALDTVFRSHSVEGAHKFLAAIKPADARPVVSGEWEDVEVIDARSRDAIGISSIASIRCSVCHRYHNEVYFYGDPTEFARFCSNCGAEMKEGET